MSILTTSRLDQERCDTQRRAGSTSVDQSVASRKSTVAESNNDPEWNRTIQRSVNCGDRCQVSHALDLPPLRSRE